VKELLPSSSHRQHHASSSPLLTTANTNTGVKDRRGSGGSNDSRYEHDLGAVGLVVETPYGMGQIVETLESSDYSVDTVEGVEARSRIMLGWGAQLYSTEKFKVRKVFENIESLSFQPNSGGAGLSINTGLMMQVAEWNQSAAAKMTSMIINLDLVQITEKLITDYFYSWQLKHHQNFLSTLELCHWHGYLFNENIQLRLNLHAISVASLSLNKSEKFTSLPQLLEQEVLSIELFLKIVFQLYFESDESRRRKVDINIDHAINLMPADVFVRPMIERISSIVLLRYLKMDRDSCSQSQTDDNMYLHFTDSLLLASLLKKFDRERCARYKSTVVIALNGILSFTEVQLLHNIEWIVPLMSKLILCSDLGVRASVQSVYTNCINPLLLHLTKR